jgi:hypothetical protein
MSTRASTGSLVIAGLVGLMAAIVVVVSRAPTPASAPPASSTATATETSSASGVKTERDPAVVFQRAFWRRPGADVRIVDGERREWSEQGTVQKWQWCLALETTPDFRRWLFEQNPFELAISREPVDAARFTALPAWFPVPAELAKLTTYRVRGSGLTVLLEAKSGRVFALDTGGGFAAAVR